MGLWIDRILCGLGLATVCVRNHRRLSTASNFCSRSNFAHACSSQPCSPFNWLLQPQAMPLLKQWQQQINRLMANQVPCYKKLQSCKIIAFYNNQLQPYRLSAQAIQVVLLCTRREGASLRLAFARHGNLVVCPGQPLRFWNWTRVNGFTPEPMKDIYRYIRKYLNDLTSLILYYSYIYLQCSCSEDCQVMIAY